jgi:hypothetical protein
VQGESILEQQAVAQLRVGEACVLGLSWVN